jgi:hypothetical protein
MLLKDILDLRLELKHKFPVGAQVLLDEHHYEVVVPEAQRQVQLVDLLGNYHHWLVLEVQDEPIFDQLRLDQQSVDVVNSSKGS